MNKNMPEVDFSASGLR